jgi:hypothetical protein
MRFRSLLRAESSRATACGPSQLLTRNRDCQEADFSKHAISPATRSRATGREPRAKARRRLFHSP